SAASRHSALKASGDCGPPLSAGNTSASSGSLPRPRTRRSSSLVQIARQHVGATTVLPIVLAGTAANKMPGRVAACTQRRNYRDVRFNPAGIGVWTQAGAPHRPTARAGPAGHWNRPAHESCWSIHLVTFPSTAFDSL